MIPDAEWFTDKGFRPPDLRKREVIFFNGVSARSGLGRQILMMSDGWQKTHLPHLVPVPFGKMDRPKMRTWLNKNITEVWAFGQVPLDQNGTGGGDAVCFSSQTEATAFRLWFC